MIKKGYNMDICTFLKHYDGMLSKSGLEKITGINQKQLWHYSSGRRKPTQKTTLQIQTGIHRFAENLRQVQFID